MVINDVTIGEKIDKYFVAEDFTGHLGELRELKQFNKLPPHLQEFINRLYNIAFDIVSE